MMRCGSSPERRSDLVERCSGRSDMSVTTSYSNCGPRCCDNFSMKTQARTAATMTSIETDATLTDLFNTCAKRKFCSKGENGSADIALKELDNNRFNRSCVA